MEDLRIGILGTGSRSKIAAYAHRPGKGSGITACVDINDTSLNQFSEKYGQDIKLYKDYKSLIADKSVDAVFIFTPDYLHEEQTIDFLEAGIPVYLEKPMALTIEGCDRILRKSYRTKTKIYVGHNMRHMAFVRKMKKLIDAGVIGEVKTAWCRHFVGRGGDCYFKDWHAEKEKSMGLLLQKASHDIDVLHWFCGGHTRRVNAMGALTLYDRIADRHGPEEYGDPVPDEKNWPPLRQKGMNSVIDVEDLNMAQMLLTNDVLVSYQQCHFTPDHWRNFTIIGTEGRMENFGDGSSNTIIKVWNKRKDYNPEGDETYTIPPANQMEYHHDSNIVNEFINYVRYDGPTTITPIEARNSVAAGYMATQSLRNGGVPLNVPPVSEELRNYFS